MWCRSLEKNTKLLHSNWINWQKTWRHNCTEKWVLGQFNIDSMLIASLVVEIGSVFEIIDSNVHQLIIVNVMASTTEPTIIDRSIKINGYILSILISELTLVRGICIGTTKMNRTEWSAYYQLKSRFDLMMESAMSPSLFFNQNNV